MADVASERLNAVVELVACPKCGAFDLDPPSDCDHCEAGGKLELRRYVAVDALQSDETGTGGDR